MTIASNNHTFLYRNLFDSLKNQTSNKKSPTLRNQSLTNISHLLKNKQLMKETKISKLMPFPISGPLMALLSSCILPNTINQAKGRWRNLIPMRNLFTQHLIASFLGWIPITTSTCKSSTRPWNLQVLAANSAVNNSHLSSCQVIQSPGRSNLSLSLPNLTTNTIHSTYRIVQDERNRILEGTSWTWAEVVLLRKCRVARLRVFTMNLWPHRSRRKRV